VKRLFRRLAGEQGTAIIETALTLPMLLLVSVGIFEFGRAYQTWQVLTNAAREGARLAVLPNPVAGAAQARVVQYLQAGQLPRALDAKVVVDGATVVNIGAAGTASGSKVTVTYPFDFIVLQPVARLLVNGSALGSSLNMVASVEMRNESQ